MKIASWNVNSLRVRLPHVLDWLDTHRPDVLGLQELKMPTEAFPTDEIAELGYQSVAYGQKTYNGVALLSLEAPDNVTTGLPNFPDEQHRVIAADYNGVRIINLYVPNGQTVGADKYIYKLAWLDALRNWLTEELAANPNIVVIGDFNIAPADRESALPTPSGCSTNRTTRSAGGITGPQPFAASAACASTWSSRLQQWSIAVQPVMSIRNHVSSNDPPIMRRCFPYSINTVDDIPHNTAHGVIATNRRSGFQPRFPRHH